MITHIRRDTPWVDNINTHITPRTARLLARAITHTTGQQRATHKRWSWHTNTGHASLTIDLAGPGNLPTITLHDKYEYHPTPSELHQLVDTLEAHSRSRAR